LERGAVYGLFDASCNMDSPDNNYYIECRFWVTPVIPAIDLALPATRMLYFGTECCPTHRAV